MEVLHDSKYPYLVHTNKGTIRSTISRNQSFILNTEKVPEKVLNTVSTITPLDSAENSRRAWLTVLGGFGTRTTRTESLNIVVPAAGINVTVSASYAGSGTFNSPKINYTAQQRVTRLLNALLANSTITSNFTVTVHGTTIALLYNTPDQPVTINHYWSTSTPTATVLRSSQSFTRAQAPTNLPSTYNGYTFTHNSVQYIYDGTRKLWLLPNQLATNLNPVGAGWVRILSGAFSKQYTVSITQGSAAAIS